jgi:predicted nucleic acid-binding protein
VLAELLHITEAKRIDFNFDILTKELQNSPNFLIISFDINILNVMLDLHSLEIHDRIIAAASIYYGVPLLTKDSELQKISLIETIW